MATFHLLETKEPNIRVLLGILLFGCIVCFVVLNLCHGTRYPPPAPNSCLKTWLVVKECTSRSHRNPYYGLKICQVRVAGLLYFIRNRDFIFCTTWTVSQHGGCNPTANETCLLPWHYEAPDKKNFWSRIGHVYQIWFPVEKWKCHMKVRSRKLWFRKVALRPFYLKNDCFDIYIAGA